MTNAYDRSAVSAGITSKKTLMGDVLHAGAFILRRPSNSRQSQQMSKFEFSDCFQLTNTVCKVGQDALLIIFSLVAFA